MSDQADGVLFALRSEDGSEGCTVTVEGEMSASNAHALEAELLRIEARGVSRIVLDLSAVDFIDSTALAVIVRAHERAKRHGHLLRLKRPQSDVNRRFELTGLDKELDFVE
jgi:anti-sigma B factor antagonist